MSAMAWPGQVVAEHLECIEIGVGAEHVDVAAGDDVLHLVLEARTLAPTSAKPAANTTANLALAAMASRRMGRGSPTRIATRSSSSSISVSALAQGRPATTGRFGLTKYTVAPRSSAQTVIFWVSAVLGRALESDAPTTATRFGRKKVSRSMARRAVGRPVMSVPSPFAVVPVAMSLPRAAPTCNRRPAASVPSGSGAARRARAGPAGALTVYDAGVSVDLERGPIVPGGEGFRPNCRASAATVTVGDRRVSLLL